MSGRISFIGAGPGAADLITVRAARRIAEADVVVWSASVLAPECVREHAGPDVELVDSSQLSHDQALEVYRRAERDGLRVVRLHAGDPALWGSVQEQHDACSRMDLDVEIVPGVNGFSAAAAAVGRELTVPESAQSVLLTRLGGGAASPDAEQVRELARHGTTMAVTLPASRSAQLVEVLRAGGCAEDVPVLVAYKVSWPDEVLLSTTIGELEQAVKQRKLWGTALFLVGKALVGTPRGQRESGYRRAETATRRRGYRSARRHGGASRPASDAGSAPADPGPAAPAPASAAPPEAPVERPVLDAGTPVAEPAPEPSGAGAEAESSAVPNIAWWAVREWQEAARGAARSQPKQRRGEDPAQSPLFAPAEPESQAEPETRPELSVVREEPAAESPAPEADAAPAEAAAEPDARESRGNAPTSAASTTGTRATAKTRSRSKTPAKQSKPQGKSTAKTRAASAKSAKNKGEASG
ncbi:SAM-dependent methyltransferase [Saccharopolyspora sp. MS10]|uniref:cobalt-precorrin-4/precorrin-4 C(11)-methyltransferase n=1 Tax=Saccharopolyspora sp. MS10 TaxID=3385973 RepID=UPI0039A34E38